MSSFVRGEATGLDTAAKGVMLAAGDRLTYDRLVVATGSQMRRPPVPGAEAAFSVDTQADAIAFDKRLGEIVRDVAQPTIAVVGAAPNRATYCALRLRAHDDDQSVVGGADLVPGLIALLGATLDAGDGPTDRPDDEEEA